jgi:hypothetical protein
LLGAPAVANKITGAASKNAILKSFDAICISPLGNPLSRPAEKAFAIAACYVNSASHMQEGGSAVPRARNRIRRRSRAILVHSPH